MDVSAINPNPSRPVAISADERALPFSGVSETASPQTAEAVRQTARTQELGEQTDRRASNELTDEEQAVVRELKARDREVRAHEQAHKRVGGQYAGAISYDYQKGPDGQRYAVGGSVPIDVSPENSPEETAAKMRVVIKAALAPAEPSAADRAVAAAAQNKLQEAQLEIAAERRAEMRGDEAQANRPSSLLSAYATPKSEGDESKLALVV